MWLMSHDPFEELLAIARTVISDLEQIDDLSSFSKHSQAFDAIKQKLAAAGKKFTNHAINLAIELALTEFRKVIVED
jgi:hypothetical protein